MKYYTPNDFAKMLNVSIDKLDQWETEGKIKAYTTPSNKKCYTYQQYIICSNITEKNWFKDTLEIIGYLIGFVLLFGYLIYVVGYIFGLGGIIATIIFLGYKMKSIKPFQ